VKSTRSSSPTACSSTRNEIVEPDSLPYGGTHRGATVYVALMQRIGELFELATLGPE
jgi:hypothetical protein